MKNQFHSPLGNGIERSDCMTISELAYELYKVDWMKRVSSECQSETIKNYYNKLSEGEAPTDYSFENYLSDNGYNGELYCSYGEFIDCEYQDEEYMRELLGDELFEKYNAEVSVNDRLDSFLEIADKISDAIDNGEVSKEALPACRDR